MMWMIQQEAQASPIHAVSERTNVCVLPSTLWQDTFQYSSSSIGMDCIVLYRRGVGSIFFRTD
jgi:hypothetical protein